MYISSLDNKSFEVGLGGWCFIDVFLTLALFLGIQEASSVHERMNTQMNE